MRYRTRLKKFRFKRSALRKNGNRLPKIKKPRRKFIWTLANNISISKIFLIPFFVMFYMFDSLAGDIVCFIIIVLAEASDYFDGYIARKYNMVSEFGKLIDPMADSLFRFSMYLTFYTDHTVPVWVVFIFFFRDIIVAYTRMGLSLQGIVLAAKKSGKIKAVFQASGSLIIILTRLGVRVELIPASMTPYIILPVVTVVCCVVLYSLFNYLIPSIQVMRGRQHS